MTATLYVPRDSGALSLGAEHVARAIAQEAARRKLDVTIVRNGSRGLYWLEPMVEVATARGRVAYGPVRAEAVPALFDAGFLEGRPHQLCLGLNRGNPLAQEPGAADLRARRSDRSDLTRRLPGARRL